jgi:undecaprenyl phosphate-alpha-L-ara4N flippase subunit ArnE
MLAWVAVLQRAPLTLAFPIMTLTYAAIPMASAFLLNERLGRTQVAGAVLVAAGVICVGVSGRV